MKHSSPAFLREKRSIHMGRIYVAQLCLAFVFVTVEVFIAVRLSFLPSNSYSRSSSSHTLFIAAYPWPATLTAFTNHQVDKLKVLADSLASSSSKAEQRILEHRFCFWTVWIIFFMAYNPIWTKYVSFLDVCFGFILWLELLLHCYTWSQFPFIIKDSVENQLNYLC